MKILKTRVMLTHRQTGESCVLDLDTKLRSGFLSHRDLWAPPGEYECEHDAESMFDDAGDVNTEEWCEIDSDGVTLLADYSAPPPRAAFEEVNVKDLLMMQKELAVPVDGTEWSQAAAETDREACGHAVRLAEAGAAVLVARDDDGVYFATSNGVRFFGRGQVLAAQEEWAAEHPECEVETDFDTDVEIKAVFDRRGWTQALFEEGLLMTPEAFKAAVYEGMDAWFAKKYVRCACGAATGEPCQWGGPPEETVVVEWMPEYLRESHRAAGNSGVYPHNGSMRLRVHTECADMLVKSDPDWAEIIKGA